MVELWIFSDGAKINISKNYFNPKTLVSFSCKSKCSLLDLLLNGAYFILIWFGHWFECESGTQLDPSVYVYFQYNFE